MKHGVRPERATHTPLFFTIYTTIFTIYTTISTIYTTIFTHTITHQFLIFYKQLLKFTLPLFFQNFWTN